MVRADYWLSVGAQPSESVAKLLKQVRKAAA
jgi:ribosomal protein S16